MWILHFLPDWIFYVILGLGLIGYTLTYFLRFIPIPAVYMYKTPIQLASIALIVFGVFMTGAIHNNAAWLERVKELEVKIAEAKAKSAEENVKIVEKVVTKIQVIRDKTDVGIKYIDREVVKYDNTCVIPEEFVKAHNNAAEMIK